MKTTITTFKQSGKWYDTFDVELPDEIEAFNHPTIRAHLFMTDTQCQNHNFIYSIKDLPQLVIHL